jgi:hypothetical protein
MFRKSALMTLLVALAVLAACTGLPLAVAPAQPATPTQPATRAAEGEAEGLVERITSLEQRLAALNAAAYEETPGVGPQSQRFQVAVYFLDNVGLHDIDVRLNEEQGVIEAADAGKVEGIGRVLAVAPWPEELQAAATELNGVLVAYAEALGNDDIEAAKPLATQVHEVGHDLSQAARAWLGESTGEHQEEGEAHEEGDEHSEEGH